MLATTAYDSACRTTKAPTVIPAITSFKIQCGE
jgi:hypothetical protein